MPSQRHLVYLLPRADPEELQDGLFPCTCSYTPLELQVRIPPNPSGASGSTSKSTQAAGGLETGTASKATPSASSRNCSKTENSPSSKDASLSRAAADTSSDSVIPRHSSRRRTSTSSPSLHTHSRSASNSISSSSNSPCPPSTSRSTRQQFATWKLIAPQVKTISPTTNTYLLQEAFAGVSSTSLQASGSNSTQEEDRGNSLLEKVQQLNLGQTSPLPTPLYSPNRYTPFPPGCDPFSTSFASASVSTPPPAASSSSASPSSASATPSVTSRTSILSPSKSSLSTIIESSLSEENVSEKSGSTNTASATNTTSPPPTSKNGTYGITPDKNCACQHPKSSACPVYTSASSGLSAATSIVTPRTGASLFSNGQDALLESARKELASNSPDTDVITTAECAKCACPDLTAKISDNIVTTPVITSPEVIQRTFSSSSVSSAAGMSRASSISGKRKPPTAYRKEMESVLFAQSASPSASSSSSVSKRKNNKKGSGGRFSSTSTIPTLTSSIFSTNTPDSIWYTHPSDVSTSTASVASSRSRPSSTTTSPASSLGSTSISNIPFLVDAPTLIDKTKSGFGSNNEDDPFYISGNNSNVIHVNDLSWYLEKVLWKLGLHRKGRKEFINYWLPRFSNDDYVAVRFLTQDAIEAFAPIEFSVVSPPPISGNKNDKTASLPIADAEVSSSSVAVANVLGQKRRDSEQSIESTSSASNQTDGRNTSSSLSSRSLSQSPSPRSHSSTPPSEIEEDSTTDEQSQEKQYSCHRIHILFQRLKNEDINLFQYRVKYRSGSSTFGIIDWSEIKGIAPTEESKREDKVRVLHVSATDLRNRGHYFG